MTVDQNSLRRQLKAIGGGSRLQILAFLKKHRSATVSDIASGVHRSIKTVSTHLMLLERSGIVKQRQRGRHVVYRLSVVQEPPVKYLLSLL